VGSGTFSSHAVWFGLEGRGGKGAKPTGAKARAVTLNIHRPFDIQRSSLAWSARLSLCFADSFNRSHDGPRSIVVVVLDALGWAADFRPVLAIFGYYSKFPRRESHIHEVLNEVYL